MSRKVSCPQMTPIHKYNNTSKYTAQNDVIKLIILLMEKHLDGCLKIKVDFWFKKWLIQNKRAHIHVDYVYTHI